MVKKLLFVLLVGVFVFTINSPILAQEEREAEDIEEFSLEELLNVEITTAGKQPEKIGEIPASVILVTREDIEKHGYQTLGEVLENIPGLYQINDYFIQNFGVRGFYTVDSLRNMIVLVNDVKQTDDFRSAYWLSQINMPAEAIDRIEVVRGPMSVIYGTGAFFGVIHIKTNIVGEEEWANTLSFSAGSDETYRLFARSSGSSGDFQYAFNAGYYDTYGIDVPLEEMGPFIGNTGGQLENTEKFFNVSLKFKDFFVDTSYAETQKEIYIVLPTISDGALNEFRSARVAFGYDKEFSAKVRARAKFDYFYARNFLDQDLLFENFWGRQLDGASGYNVELNLFLNPVPELNLLFGVDYRKVLDVQNDYRYPFFALGPLWAKLIDPIVTQSAFVQLNWKISDQFKIVAGARVEQVPEFTAERRFGDFAAGNYTTVQFTYSQTDPEFIPRVALLFLPNEKNAVKLLYGQAINRPSFFQIIDNRLGGFYVQPLEPETIRTFELNYLGTLSPKLSVSLSVFYNLLENLIFRTFLTDAEGNLIQSQANVGEMTTTGAELSITARPTPDFHLELSGTLQETKDKREGFEDIVPGYSPKFLGYAKASYFFNKDISLSVTGTFVGAMEAFYDTWLGARVGEKVDGYFLLGANLRFRNLFGTGMFLNIRGSNLLDEEIRYPATSNNPLFAPQGTFGRGMSLLATLGYRFMPIP
ncbi:MAG: TonB-dependent receptor [Candidatus Aminicenantes bacterium]|nr:TonB-dependent receptor [Candidatus Aminicenantes bacterium]NIM83333.1 TonB-dependent receptor [Candidatus Aminicenantes bacterium]NIN22692.1 TonB-dependent receptor [Candidatus Aminicenantes bacterium]NIN46452.1 TonB-dependent receptor [Candidatus Aminicenantes bacterium]NIN89304.1 TonB-dependent receptor [Candidatus Aminicenantes bacterium]